MEESKKRRQFSEAFKKEKVQMIERKQISVLQLSRLYEVSTVAIYKWLRKYSQKFSQGERVVVEKESEGAKTMSLLNKVAELERKLGQKQLQIDYLEKLLELGSEEIGIDIKKKYATEPSTTSVKQQNKRV